MTLRQLSEVLAYAELCKVNITSERTSYFEHTVIIASERFENMEDAVKRISELRNKAAAIRKRLQKVHQWKKKCLITLTISITK